jgi:hypothetical protein
MARAGTLRAGLAGLVRRWLPDRNPLRRASDRVEAVMLAALLVAFLAGAPLAALAAGHWEAGAMLRAQRAEAAAMQRVPAVLTQDAPVPVHVMFQGAPAPLARAKWTAPDGAARTGMVNAPAGSRAGRTVMVWTDRSGRLAGAPLQGTDVTIRAGLVALLAVVAVGLLLAMAGSAFRRALDRQRLAAWDGGWSATGPQWTGRR